MGAQLRVYRQKIRSARTTKKITRAMELIAASRIQKALQRVRASAPFARAVTRAVSAVAAVLQHQPRAHHRAGHDRSRCDRRVRLGPWPGRRASTRTCCGRAKSSPPCCADRARRSSSTSSAAARSGYFAFRKRAIEKAWTGDTDSPTFAVAEEIGDEVVARFIQSSAEGGVDEIHIVYNRFVSMLTQQPEVVRLLPLEVVEGVEEPGDKAALPLCEFEPEDPGTVLDALLPVYIQTRIFNAMLQSAASKHAATQKAMKSASDNADTLVRDYTRLANNARPAEITQQISEIVGGADALVASKKAKKRTAWLLQRKNAPATEGRDRRRPVESHGSPDRSSTSSSRTMRSPTSTSALKTDITLERRERRDHARGQRSTSATTWSVPIALKPTRRHGPRPGGARHRCADLRAGRRCHQGQGVQRDRRGAQRRARREDRDHRALADPPQAAALRPARVEDPDVRNGHQGHRPARRRTCSAERSACSAVPASARPCSSRR